MIENLTGQKIGHWKLLLLKGNEAYLRVCMCVYIYIHTYTPKKGSNGKVLGKINEN